MIDGCIFIVRTYREPALRRSGRGPQTKRVSELAAIEAVLASDVDGIHRGDVDPLRRVFHPDADLSANCSSTGRCSRYR